MDQLWNEFNELLRYDQESGVVYYRKAPPVSGYNLHDGDEAGCINRLGYRVITHKGKQYRTHRIVWLLNKMRWPKGMIDHINGIKTDNRLENLRDVSNRVNMSNMPRHRNGAYPGVENHASGRYRARIFHEGKMLQVGIFSSAEEAHKAYRRASEEADNAEVITVMRIRSKANV
jgi:hypothetical protein